MFLKGRPKAYFLLTYVLPDRQTDTFCILNKITHLNLNLKSVLIGLLIGLLINIIPFFRILKLPPQF